MADIAKSFVFLHDNVPSWITDLAQIQDKVNTMQDEIAKIPVILRPSMRRKTGSIESIRDMDVIMEGNSTPTTAQPNPTATRKRKPASILSGQGSLPTKYRSRALILVHYDGQIQKQFENLVRSIGSGRNLLRKGKMAAMAARMEEMANMVSSDEESQEDDEAIMSKIQYRRRTGVTSMRSRGAMRGGYGASTPTTTSTTTPESVFESVDKALEQAQSLCEKAAHQSLREGQCRKELEGMKTYFEQVMESTSTEKARYDAIAEAQPTADAESDTPASTRPRYTTNWTTGVKPIIPAIQNPMPKPSPPAKGMDIEIDDDDDDDELDFVMPPVRMASRA